MLIARFPALCTSHMTGPLYVHRADMLEPPFSLSQTPPWYKLGVRDRPKNVPIRYPATTGRFTTDRNHNYNFFVASHDRSILLQRIIPREANLIGLDFCLNHWTAGVSWLLINLIYVCTGPHQCTYNFNSLFKVLLHSPVRDETAVFSLDYVPYRSDKTAPAKKKQILRPVSSSFLHGF